MTRAYESDRVQCQAMTEKKVRCTLAATHSDGGKALCDRHVQIARRNRANGALIKKEVGK